MTPPTATTLRPGDRVALLVPGSRTYVEAVMSLLADGVFPIPLDPRLTAYERERILANLDPARTITDSASLEALASTSSAIGLPLGRPMHVTSGTTGTPKGVFSGLLTPEHAQALVDEERDLWGFTDSDVNLVLSPLYHSAPLRFAMGTLLAGGTLTGFDDDGNQPAFDPARITETIERDRPTSMFCVPAHLQRLIAHWDEHGVPDLSCFRLVAHAGAACPDVVKRRIIELFPAGSTWEFYGSTEGQFTACRSEEWLDHPGTVGRARQGRTLEIVDGQIWCSVPPHARFTYFNDTEKTEAAWRGGSFSVGDLGRLDADGYLYLDGRREDLVITGGVNVYPTEVENTLAEHPGVADVAVYGVTDEHWGQRVVATVVGSATADELDAWARERLAPPKRPKEYRYAAELPRTLTGKVRRRELASEPGIEPGE